MCSLPICVYGAYRGHHVSGTGIINGCEQRGGCWERDPGPVQEQQMLFTSERFLHAQLLSFLPIQIGPLAGAEAFYNWCNNSHFLKSPRPLNSQRHRPYLDSRGRQLSYAAVSESSFPSVCLRREGDFGAGWKGEALELPSRGELSGLGGECRIC